MVSSRARALPRRAPGLLMGAGFGGSFDIIALHMVLQWHHMVSHQESPDTIAGLETNVLADGLFHTLAIVLVGAGSVLMIRSWREDRLSPNWQSHLGLLLTGWGLFNVVEGLVDHHLLQVHHVRDDLGAPLPWDLGFLAFGVALVVGGWLLHRAGERRLEQRAARTGPGSRGEM